MKKKNFLIFSAVLIVALIYFIFNIEFENKETRGKWISTKGGEVADVHQWNSYQKIIEELNLAWARIPIEWSNIEISDGKYDWNSTEYINFKNATASAIKMGTEVILTVRDAPDFLIDPVYGVGSGGTATPWPKLCGRITAEGNVHLANFIMALLQQLRLDFGFGQNDPPPVTYVEMWNEPDVDPSQTIRPDLYGCWQRGFTSGAGTPTATGTLPPYETGSYYAEVINSVAPAVKGQFPTIKFVAGASISASSGFLPAIIDHALSNIDVVSYHQYVKTSNTSCDLSSLIATQENSFDVVRAYLDTHGGSSKPILISEGAAGYTIDTLTPVPESTATPAPSFYDCQAKFATGLLAWSQEKAKTGRLLGFIWYTIGRNGWEETDLLYPNKTPKPVYFSWKN